MRTENAAAIAGSPSRVERKQVVVVGGGVIGLSSAYHIARQGDEVTVIDSNDFGGGASWGNAGWIVPSLVRPFNAPGAVADALKSMLHQDSPIAVRQLPSFGLLKWGAQFTRASRAGRSDASLRKLAKLAASANREMLDLADQLGFELHRAGLLVPFRSLEALEAYATAHQDIERLGYSGRVDRLGREILEREPSLGADVVGGLHFVDEMSVRPSSFSAALVEAIVRSGNETAAFERVETIEPLGARRWRVSTNRRTLEADAVVVAAGEYTGELLRPLGIKIALQAGRGCSVLLQPRQLSLMQPLKIAEHRVACTPFLNGEVRISGTFDLVRTGSGPAVGRMRSVLRLASSYLPALSDVEIRPSDVWSGARPCTPDSVPLVKQATGHVGLFVATGHGTLGVTLAPETGRRVAAMVHGHINHSTEGNATR